jgi:hypothetical protein
LVHVSCGVKCFYGSPVSSLLGDIDSISPDCPLAEAPTAETGGSVGDTTHNTGSPKLPDNIKERILSWNHRFSDPNIPAGQYGAAGLVIDNCEIDDFIRQLRAGA